MKRISLCSFTYNDGELLHGLLADVQTWPRRPDEIILVDDGSEPCFELTEQEKKLPVRLLRLPQNRGFREVKHHGLSAASGDIIISLDCDARLQGNFLNNAEKMLEDPRAGLVGIADARQAAADTLSSYINVFEAKPHPEGAEETEFLAGVAFALRRELWEEIGGFSGYSGTLAEDHYLSATLRKRGYKLLLERESHLRYVRRITRDVFCRRLWKWCGHSWLAGLNGDTPLPEQFRTMLLQTRWRCAEISGKHDLAWAYFELLHLAHIYLELCNALGPQGLLPINAGEELIRTLQTGLAGYPALFRLLKADLLRSGALPLKEVKAPAPQNKSRLAAECEWAYLAEFLHELNESLLFEYLDKKGVRDILADEAALRTDFSSY